MASSRSKPDSSARPYTRSETAFNADFREVLRAQDLGVLHVRDTDTPGVFDLLCTYEDWDGRKMSVQHFWVELKVWDEPLRPSQITFQRERGTEVMFVLRLREGYAVRVNNRDDQKEIWWTADFRLHDWRETFMRQVAIEYNRK